MKLGTLVKCQEMKVKFDSQPFLTNGSGFILKKLFLQNKKSIFRPNYSRYEKMFKSKIVHLKQTYKFYFNHFLEKCRIFILIKKNVVKNKKLWFSAKQCKIRKNVNK